jgi:pilus assembly protein CpaC
MNTLARAALVAAELTGIWLIVGTVARAAEPAPAAMVLASAPAQARAHAVAKSGAAVQPRHGRKAGHHGGRKVAAHRAHQPAVAGAAHPAHHGLRAVVATLGSVGPLVDASPLPTPAPEPVAATPEPSRGAGGAAVPADVRRLAAQASRWPVAPASSAPVMLESGGGRVLTLTSDAANVFVADPKVAEVRPASANSLFVFGVGAGRTTVAAMDASGHVLAQFNVTVRQSGFNAGEAEAAIARLMPGDHIGVVPEAKGLLLTGSVATAGEAARATTIARGFLGDGQAIENQIAVGANVQIMLRVRIAEMSRVVTRALGVNWAAAARLGTSSALGGFSAGLVTANALVTAAPNVAVAGFDKLGVDAVIDALAQDNLVRVLAEPNMTVMSGEPASFLAGGSFPIPVGQQNGQMSVEFKNYGVSLSFVPTVMADGRINLRVNPEVSELTNVGAVQIAAGNSSIQIPALTVRRADTTVELGSGQSFAIAGLLQKTSNQADNGVPGLGDVPILGALFRSDSFQRNESELVIVVTPYIVRPVSNTAALALPTDGVTPPGDLDRILHLRQVASSNSGLPSRIPGQAGFIVQ